jgi:hypothetical protein
MKFGTPGNPARCSSPLKGSFMSRIHRILLTLVALLALSLPLAAQARPSQDGNPAASLLAAVWERLTAPLSALWAAASPATSVPVPPPPPPPIQDPGASTDGRSTIDPIG